MAASVAACGGATPATQELTPGSAEPSAAQSATATPRERATPVPLTPPPVGEFDKSTTVPGTANIYGAGRAFPPSPGGGGGGDFPVVWELSPDARFVTFPSATGEVISVVGNSVPNGPAGDKAGSTKVESFGGISGIVDRHNGMFLVGVFLTDEEPADPAPAVLDFTDKEQFSVLAPKIAQTFFIGDGKGRRYEVPSGATRLYLGFADAAAYNGPPGWYGNNAGQLQVTVAVEEQ
jgi:hypothetical protein